MKNVGSVVTMAFEHGVGTNYTVVDIGTVSLKGLAMVLYGQT